MIETQPFAAAGAATVATVIEASRAAKPRSATVCAVEMIRCASAREPPVSGAGGSGHVARLLALGVVAGAAEDLEA